MKEPPICQVLSNLTDAFDEKHGHTPDHFAVDVDYWNELYDYCEERERRSRVIGVGPANLELKIKRDKALAFQGIPVLKAPGTPGNYVGTFRIAWACKVFTMSELLKEDTPPRTATEAVMAEEKAPSILDRLTRLEAREIDTTEKLASLRRRIERLETEDETEAEDTGPHPSRRALNDAKCALTLAHSVLETQSLLHCRVAGNGPTIGTVIDQACLKIDEELRRQERQ